MPNDSLRPAATLTVRSLAVPVPHRELRSRECSLVTVRESRFHRTMPWQRRSPPPQHSKTHKCNSSLQGSWQQGTAFPWRSPRSYLPPGGEYAARVRPKHRSSKLFLAALPAPAPSFPPSESSSRRPLLFVPAAPLASPGQSWDRRCVDQRTE